MFSLDSAEKNGYNVSSKAEVTASHPAAQPAVVARDMIAQSIFYVFNESGRCCQLSFFIHRTDIIREGSTISANDLMINEEIRDREVRVIDQNGEQLGVMATHAALELAEEKQLDLVKIAPQAKPPVCKIMDYGKYRFEQSKREKEARKNQKVISVKEVRLSPTIEEHDTQVRVRDCIKFLGNGDKVKVSIRFRGRMITHSEVGLDVMNEFYERVKDYAVMDRKPSTEGRTMTMMLSPKQDK